MLEEEKVYAWKREGLCLKKRRFMLEEEKVMLEEEMVYARGREGVCLKKRRFMLEEEKVYA